MKILTDDNLIKDEKEKRMKLGINGFMFFIYDDNAKSHDFITGKKR